MALALTGTTKMIMHFKDPAGKHSTMEVWLDGLVVDPTAGAASAIWAAAEELSDCGLDNVEVAPAAVDSAPAAAGTGAYDRVQDKMYLGFTGADGSQVAMNLPTFLASVLATDKTNVNPANAAVIAFVNYVKANLSTADGKALTGLNRGYKRRPPGLKSH